VVLRYGVAASHHGMWFLSLGGAGLLRKSVFVIVGHNVGSAVCSGSFAEEGSTLPALNSLFPFL